jgi:hypothetical protein
VEPSFPPFLPPAGPFWCNISDILQGWPARQASGGHTLRGTLGTRYAISQPYGSNTCSLHDSTQPAPSVTNRRKYCLWGTPEIH